MTKSSNTNNAMLIIDLKNKFMFLGKTQYFTESVTTSKNNYHEAFYDNLMYLIGNASKYGSHFTDLLLEDDQTGSMPAPWDDYWGTNKGVPSK